MQVRKNVSPPPLPPGDGWREGLTCLRPSREIFERSREASGAGGLETQHLQVLCELPPREVFERSREASGAGRLETQHLQVLCELPSREVFERSREASGAGGLETQHLQVLCELPPREVFERSREASGAGGLETQHMKSQPLRGCDVQKEIRIIIARIRGFQPRILRFSPFGAMDRVLSFHTSSPACFSTSLEDLAGRTSHNDFA
jgi:hypothetical protein